VLQISEALSACQEPEDLTRILTEQLRRFLNFLQFYIIVYKEHSTEVEWAVLGLEKGLISSKGSKSVRIFGDCRIRGVIGLPGHLNRVRRLQFLRATGYGVGKDLNIDSGRVHRSDPFVAYIVDTAWEALRWFTTESTQFFPLIINLLYRISIVGLPHSGCVEMLFKRDDLHD
jgi:hypothetical protein